MNREDYLQDKDVQCFTGWFRSQLNTRTFSHSYLNRRTKKQWNCIGLSDAFNQYEWPSTSGHNFADNAMELQRLKCHLDNALARKRTRLPARRRLKS